MEYSHASVLYTLYMYMYRQERGELGAYLVAKMVSHSVLARYQLTAWCVGNTREYATN